MQPLLPFPSGHNSPRHLYQLCQRLLRSYNVSPFAAPEKNLHKTRGDLIQPSFVLPSNDFLQADSGPLQHRQLTTEKITQRGPESAWQENVFEKLMPKRPPRVLCDFIVGPRLSLHPDVLSEQASRTFAVPLENRCKGVKLGFF